MQDVCLEEQATTPAFPLKKRNDIVKLHSREGSLTNSQHCLLVENDSEIVRLLDFEHSQIPAAADPTQSSEPEWDISFYQLPLVSTALLHVA